jgi:hypothetical protein
VPALTIVQLLPLFVEYSIFTFVTPFCDQVILCEVPDVQFSPPAGAVRVMLGGAEIVNTLLLRSLVAAFEASLMRTFACVVGEYGTVHE